VGWFDSRLENTWTWRNCKEVEACAQEEARLWPLGKVLKRLKKDSEKMIGSAVKPVSSVNMVIVVILLSGSAELKLDFIDF
jgi:hypothetical protein